MGGGGSSRRRITRVSRLVVPLLTAAAMAAFGLPAAASAGARHHHHRRRATPVPYVAATDTAAAPPPPPPSQADLTPFYEPETENTSEDADLQGGAQPTAQPAPASPVLAHSHQLQGLAAACNGVPNSPNLQSPGAATGTNIIQSTTPVLKIVQVPNDCDGELVLVNYRVATDSGFTNIVWHSGWTGEQSIPPPGGVLFDGQTYFWDVQSADVCNISTLALCTQPAAGWPVSGTWQFTVSERHFGTDSRFIMWSRQIGDQMTLSVNESNGNVVLKAPLGRVDTITGKLRYGFSYNSQNNGTNSDRGFGPGWRFYAGADSGGGQVPVGIEQLQASDEFRITFESGRRVNYQHFTGPLYLSGDQGGRLRIAQPDLANYANCTLSKCAIYTSAQGDEFDFDASGNLVESQVSIARDTDGVKGGYSFNYTFNTAGHLTQVQAPKAPGQTNPDNVTLTWSAGQLSSITDTTGRTYAVSYSGGSVSGLTISYSYTPPGRAQVLKTRRLLFCYDANGNLSQVQNGAQTDLSADRCSVGDGFQIAYQNDTTAGVWRATKVFPPGVSTASNEFYGFSYTPFSGAHATSSTVSETDLTDPRGELTSGAAGTVASLDYQTNTRFNYAGLPIQQDGPLLFSSAADTAGYWPQTTWVWDNHDELVCQRDPAANAEKRGCFLRADGTVNDGADGLATTYTYDTLTPYPMLSETDPRPNPDGTGTRRSVSFKYDGSSSFNGLWSEEFNSQYATGLPVNEGMWSTFDNYSGVPGPVDGTHDWAMRFSGYLVASSSTKYFFKVVSSNPILLAVGNHVLFDCFDQGTRLGSTQKASNCDGSDASAVMFGGRQTFTFEIGSSAGGGQVSFSMKWGKATASGSPPSTFTAIGATDTDPNLVLMTRRETAPPGSPGAYSPDLVENWSYVNDFQMSSRQPDSYTRTDASTDAANDPMAAQARQTSYNYDHASGRLLTKVLPDPAGLGASEQPKYLYTYADSNDPGCRFGPLA